MAKTNPSHPLNNMNFQEDWTSHPAVEWISKNKNTLLWAFFGLVIGLLIASRLITWRTLDAEKDFFQAQTAFTEFQEEAGSSEKKEDSNAVQSLEQLEGIMNRHPELKAKYQGALAQTLLVTNQVPLAQSFIQDIAKRTAPDHLQPFQLYTQTSLLIQQAQYKEALQQAKQLKSQLEQQNIEENPTLFLFNLIRIGLLEQQLGNSEGELAAWEELGNQRFQGEALAKIGEASQIGKVSLDQYINERKKTLKR